MTFDEGFTASSVKEQWSGKEVDELENEKVKE